MAGYVEIFVDQFSDYSTVITITNSDGSFTNLAGYSVVSQIRTSYTTANATANLICFVSDAANGNVTLSVPANLSITIPPGRYYYDIRTMSPTGANNRIMQGIFELAADVSR